MSFRRGLIIKNPDNASLLQLKQTGISKDKHGNLVWLPSFYKPWNTHVISYYSWAFDLYWSLFVRYRSIVFLQNQINSPNFFES